ncbi:DUF6265 family protein [Flaviaesturariibacter aridisoli]|uniref:DUF6265 domain-containing protein n=1 Tax=Flaviaesturariibacter aridisoli TaxID=2545761 RepID=A0A4R4E293_9BACT|nr:DUF6265 family protein [Flaviaesturariibacter aridisoli]TCZ73624.1 hypothetical protein E0486_04905 [Flaviaesturariibacter aridisoli]
MRYSVLLLPLLVAACTEPPRKHFPQIEKLAWLEGRWQVISVPPSGTLPPDTTIESWTRENDSVLVATSWKYTGADSSFSERMRLEEHGGHLEFAATVPGQNEGKAVVFPGSDSGGITTFINDRHDFPQRIRYTPAGADAAVAEIAGHTDQGYQRFTFRMKRLR